MNQSELNKVAMNFIYSQGLEVADKLRETLECDIENRFKSKEVSGQTLHYIHNIALFDCMVWLNSLIALNDVSEETIDQYFDFADKLRAKFFDVVNELKDFQPSK